MDVADADTQEGRQLADELIGLRGAEEGAVVEVDAVLVDHVEHVRAGEVGQSFPCGTGSAHIRHNAAGETLGITR